MKQSKTRRILAIAGIGILLALYITTLLLAIFGNENTHSWFMACICATVIVPVLMWVYQWLYKLLKKEVSDSRRSQTEDPDHPDQDDSI